MQRARGRLAHAMSASLWRIALRAHLMMLARAASAEPTLFALPPTFAFAVRLLGARHFACVAHSALPFGARATRLRRLFASALCATTSAKIQVFFSAGPCTCIRELCKTHFTNEITVTKRVNRAAGRAFPRKRALGNGKRSARRDLLFLLSCKHIADAA